MNILHIVFNQTGVGSYWRAFQYGQELTKRGHNITLMCTSPLEFKSIREYKLEGIVHVETPDLFRGSLRSGWDPWNTLQRINWLRKQRFDLVYAIESRPTVIYPALYLHHFHKVPLVLGWSDWFGRGGSVEQRENPVIRTILRPIETYFEEHFRTKADGTTAICSVLQEKAIQLGVPSETISIIPDSCSPEIVSYQDIDKAKSIIGLNPKDFVLGYVGSIVKSDAILMAQAFDLVVKKHPNVKLLVIGYCQLQIGTLSKYPESIIQTGPISQHDLIINLTSCDIFWLPLNNNNYNRGRWPHKLNDYMSIGRPTIATAVGDVISLFADEPIGLLSLDTPNAFAYKTIQLIENPQQRKEMGDYSRIIAIKKFNIKTLTDKLEALYYESIDRHNNLKSI
jgi:glycosyltransferase involved in cell wall biosynthesis